jgi:hypothetical protein
MKFSDRQLISHELFYHFEWKVDWVLNKYDLYYYKDVIKDHVLKKLEENKLSFDELDKKSPAELAEIKLDVNKWLKHTKHKSIIGWFSMVVTNKCNDIKGSVEFKSRLNSTSINNLPFLAIDDAPVVNPHFIDDTYKLIVEELMMNLPETQMQAILMRIEGNLKGHEIEQILNITNAAQYIKRGLETLKVELKRRGIESFPFHE